MIQQPTNQTTNSDTENDETLPSWFVRQRLIAIDTFLSHMGYWNCSIGEDQFGVTLRQSRRDFSLYNKYSMQKNATYDRQHYRYATLPTFESIYSKLNPTFPYPPYDLLLHQLKSLTQLPNHIELTKNALIPSNRQRLIPTVFSTLYQSIKLNTKTIITFATTKRPEGEVVNIIGHTLFYAGEWYLRALNTKTKRYANYIVSRILSATTILVPMKSVLANDTDWNQRVLINFQLKSDDEAELFYRLYNFPPSGNGLGLLDTRKAMANELLSQMHLASYPDPLSRTQLKVGPIEEIGKNSKYRKDLLWSNSK